MDELQRDLTDYLHESLGVSIRFSPWETARSLPLYLSGLYEFLCAEVMGCSCLFLLTRDGESVTPPVLAKHLFQIQNAWPGEVVYVCPTMPAYNRQRMVQKHIQFIVPHTHLYMPSLCVEFRERTRQKQLWLPRKTFAPATQKVLLHLLLSQDIIPSASEMAGLLGCKVMTISRAFSELEAARLVSAEKQGRTKLVHLSGPKRNVWEKAQPFLLNPVSKVYSIGPNEHPPICEPLASLSALSHYSMLAEPKGRTFAFSRAGAKHLLADHLHLTRRVDDPDWIAVEVWKYHPELIADKRGVVDPLSLALSLQGETDERVQMAVEQMIGDLPW